MFCSFLFKFCKALQKYCASIIVLYTVHDLPWNWLKQHNFPRLSNIIVSNEKKKLNSYQIKSLVEKAEGSEHFVLELEFVQIILQDDVKCEDYSLLV